MKKNYIAPSMEMTNIELQQMIAESGVYSNNGITYGGGDGTGKTPSSRRRNIWEDDEEDF